MKTMFSKRCLVVFCVTLVILFLVSFGDAAQQPKATLKTFSGDVIVSKLGRPDAPATRSTVLSQGDAIQTHAGAAALLELSDGSTVELNEQTMAYLAVLEQSGRARATHLYLLWGHIRVVLTAAHQKKGSAFQVETLNAITNLTFSAPNVEVMYKPESDTTFAVAHTVDVSLKNLSTGQTKMITAGQTGIVQGQKIDVRHDMTPSPQEGIKFFSTMPPVLERRPIRELLQTFQETRREREIYRHFGMTVETPPQVIQPQPDQIAPLPEVIQPVLLTKKGAPSVSGWSKTKTAIAIGGLAAVTGTGVLLANMDDDNDDDEEEEEEDSGEITFTGVFRRETIQSYGTEMMQFELLQSETTITGNRTHSLDVPDCGSTSYTLLVTGVIEENSVTLSFPSYYDVMTRVECPDDSEYLISTEGGTCQAELTDTGAVLRLFDCTGGMQEDGDYLRQ